MIGDKIRQLRKEKGMTLNELKEKIDGAATVQALSQYELNKREPSLEMIEKLATALEIPLAELIGNSNFESYAFDRFQKIFEEKLYDEILGNPTPEDMSPDIKALFSLSYLFLYLKITPDGYGFGNNDVVRKLLLSPELKDYLSYLYYKFSINDTNPEIR